jgi:hypothetical protein
MNYRKYCKLCAGAWAIYALFSFQRQKGLLFLPALLKPTIAALRQQK